MALSTLPLDDLQQTRTPNTQTPSGYALVPCEPHATRLTRPPRPTRHPVDATPGHIETAKALLDGGADPNGRAHGGAAETELPLLLALTLPDHPTSAREMARLLRLGGADPAMRDSEGRDAPALAQLWRPHDAALLEELSRPLAVPSLPPGWLEAADKTGRPFYFHARTKEARWEPPLLPIA